MTQKPHPMERFENINLKQYNTFGISALADEMYNCYDEEEVHEALKRTAGRRRYVIGGGSNILLLGDFHGAIIRPLIGGVEIRLSDSDYTYVTAGAGVE